MTKAKKKTEVKKEAPAEEEVKTVAPEPTPEVVPVTAPKPRAEKSEGSEIASAIAEGLKSAGKGRPIKITADHSVQSRFSVVRSKETGEVMLRENATNVISKVQLQSLEEKEASIQHQEVEEI